MPRLEFLRARFDAGLAAVHYPPGLGGQGLPRALQPVVDAEFAAAGAPANQPERNPIGLGMAAPTILAFGNEEQKARWLRPLWTGEEIWCQLFSEPGAGSDLAGLATRAVHQDGPDGGQWVVNGQKVWTSVAHHAQWGLLLARTDPDVPKHAGLTYFGCDMTGAGVEVRPLRQLTGEAEFNEVFLTGAVVPDADRIGAVGEGWRVAQGTLMNERVSIGGTAGAPGRRDDRPGRADLAGAPRAAHPRAARPDAAAVGRRRGGPAGLGAAPPAAGRGPARPGGVSGQAGLRPAQPGDHRASRSSWPAAAGLRYDDWTMRRSGDVNFYGRDVGYRYLRSRGNSIEGGTSEILRNIIAERVLGLPAEPRTDTRVPWKDLPR